MSGSVVRKISSVSMSTPGRWVQALVLRDVFLRRSHVYWMLPTIVAFVLIGSLRIMATPLVDNLGGNPDEVFHFARSLERARVLAHDFGLPQPRFSGAKLTALGTRGDDLCALGIGGDPECVRDTSRLPKGSGELRGSGVYLSHGIVQLLTPVGDTYSRLRLGRFAALSVGLMLLGVTYQLSYLLFRDRRVAISASALIVLLPSVHANMSGISVEGPALLATAVVLWLTTIIYLRGFSLGRLVCLGIGFLACMYTKITALVVIPAVLMLLMHHIGFRWRWLMLSLLLAFSSLAVGVWMIPSESAGVAHWYFERPPAMVPLHGSSATLAFQVEESLDSVADKDDETNLFAGAPLGRHMFFTKTNQTVVQFLPRGVTRLLAGKVLSVGAWMKAPLGNLINYPEVILVTDSGNQTTFSSGSFAASGSWEFAAYEVQLPSQVVDIGVMLSNRSSDEMVWDGIAMVVGSRLGSGRPPMFYDSSGSAGEWSGVPFDNLLKNGSAERSWNYVPEGVRYFISNALTHTTGNRLNGQLFSLYDIERTGTGYLSGIRSIFVTFWGSFVGGDWPGLARWHYGVIAGLLLVSGLGWLRRIFRMGLFPQAMPLSIAFTFLLAVLMYLFVGVFRMEISAEWAPPLFYATGRHVMPAITMVVLLTLGGLTHLFSKRVLLTVLALLVAGAFLANTWMLLRVELPYFGCQMEVLWDCTAL
ncbi:MAG: hypothetical protein MK000_02465 [Anaerolineales bacterium]|nr:hypothetical protein [Anaerolineales bacterium]